ncbi:selenocysteine lyase isoform X4 [Muntiacus reevesi]|uniref:selenocysteine lyase isoform X4 n=1 Tax=Muntiacus reevesi TaxID=9886 RepID=UPI003307200F
MEAAGARSRDARGRAEKSPPESRKVYMDYNATTPLEPEVIEAMTEAMREAWGNPSSSYPAGRKAKEIINTARENLAKMIGGQPQDVIFTSGGTESNNLVIQSVVKHFHKVHAANGDTGGRPSPVDGALPHIITCTVEHDSIRLPLEHLGEEHVAEVTFVPVSKVNGQVEAEDILAAIRPATCLVTIMLANNETGVVMPVPEISRRVRALNQQRAAGGLPGVLVHTDAAQALGKRRVDVRDLGVDFLTIVGHKFYGPRIGALYVRGLGEQTPLYPMLFGGGQERNFRPGTENTPMIAGLGKPPLPARCSPPGDSDVSLGSSLPPAIAGQTLTSGETQVPTCFLSPRRVLVSLPGVPLVTRALAEKPRRGPWSSLSSPPAPDAAAGPVHPASATDEGLPLVHLHRA